jgi:predicted RecA/RadA family phage recombinase
MALNEVYKDAQSLSYVVNQNVESGDFVWVSAGIRGVAETDAELGADGSYYATIRHSGVFTGTTADAVTVGAAIYLASAATYGTALTTTAGSNKLVGYAIKAKSGVAGDVFVRINN